MKCDKAQDLFSNYLEKTVQPPMGVAFEQHLAECARCKAAYDRFHATTIVLDELTMMEPPPDLHSTIMARIEQARREAPGRVKWLHLDWQNVFTVRVSTKALAACAAAVLVLVVLMQVTPLHTYMAGIFGMQRASGHLPYEVDYGTPPEPAGVGTSSRFSYADVGNGLSVGVRADTSNPAKTLYDIRLAAHGNASMPIQVYQLPDGSISDGVQASDLTSVLYVGAVFGGKERTVRIIQSDPSRETKTAMIVWKNDGGSFSEFVFLPPAFGCAAQNASLSASDAGVCEILSELSADYGSVILAAGECAAKTGTVSVGVSTADEAMATAARQAGLGVHRLQRSIFVVR